MLKHDRPWSNDSHATASPSWALTLLIVASGVFAVCVTFAEPALNLRAKTLEGKPVQLSEFLEDGPVLLQFWRSCCRPCHRALAHLQEIHEQFSERGLVVVAISVDETRSLGRAASLLKTSDYGFTALFDPNQQAFKKVSGRAVPHTILISADGRLVYSHIGYRDGDELDWRQAVEQMMREWTAHASDSTSVETASPRGGVGHGAAR